MASISIHPIPPENSPDLAARNVIYAAQQKPSLLPLPDRRPRTIPLEILDRFRDLPSIMNIPRTIKFGHTTKVIKGVYRKLKYYSPMIMFAVINFVILPVPDGMSFFCEQFILAKTAEYRKAGEWRLMEWEQAKSIMRNLRTALKTVIIPI